MSEASREAGAKLRVTIVGPLPPPVGGVETVTKAVLESDAFRKYELRHCDTTKERPKHTQGRFDAGNFWWAMIHFRRMLSNIIRFRPQVVYLPVTATWSGFWRDGVLALISRLGRAKVVGHVHGAWFDRILARGGISGMLVRACLRQYDTLLLLGTSWKQLVQRYGYRGGVLIVPPTVAYASVRAAEACQRNYDAPVPQGLFVGQVGARKGVFELLEALHQLKRVRVVAGMTIVGAAEFEGEWEAVKARWKQLELHDMVRFTGPLTDAAVHNEFMAADYFVLPSYSEGLPISILEAGMFGLPVITTPVGAISDVLEDGRNALIVRPGDVEALRDAIVKLVSEADLRRRLGMELRKDAVRFEPDSICRQIAAAIENKNPSLSVSAVQESIE